MHFSGHKLLVLLCIETNNAFVDGVFEVKWPSKDLLMALWEKLYKECCWLLLPYVETFYISLLKLLLQNCSAFGVPNYSLNGRTKTFIIILCRENKWLVNFEAINHQQQHKSRTGSNVHLRTATKHSGKFLMCGKRFTVLIAQVEKKIFLHMCNPILDSKCVNNGHTFAQ